ncbi:PEP-CTERM sorting domain-containing protein [Posidoniimonas corsicana]|nr:PEP-CTERM sorting domain-containing protein [Posidoniimonas corsicana]
MIARVAACWLVCCVASAQLRVVSWNTNGGARDGTATVLEAIGLEEVNGIAKPIDVLSLQEQSGGDTQSIVDVLNGIYGAGIYAAAPVPTNAQSSGAGLPGLVYNTQTVDLLETIAFGSVNTSAQARSTLRYRLVPEGYHQRASFLVYSNHYKASTGGSNEARRLVEANALRSDLDAMNESQAAILSGDFNTYSSSEPGYHALLAPGPGQAFDPVASPGNWHDNSAFRALHTQSPATSPKFAGQVTGGIDDRFDFQLVTGELLDNEGLDLLAGSYRTFGNNGTHSLNGSITTGAGASPGVLAALESSSDHLPVVADYQVPAVLSFEAIPREYFTAPVGEPLAFRFTARNAADVAIDIAADELDLVLTAVGNSVGSGEITDTLLVSDGAVDYGFQVDTSTLGGKFLTVTAYGYHTAELSTLAWSQAGIVFEGDYNGDGSVDAADYTVWRENVGNDLYAMHNVAITWAEHESLPENRRTIGLPEYELWRDNYGRRLSDIVGAATAVPEPAAVALLLAGSLATGWRRREANPNRFPRSPEAQ